MSHHNKLRSDKTCLNCKHVVDQRFCPNCGQENTDTRKTFHHLFVHFFEDLTHYENAFWKTIKNLLFKPAALTKEYLSGKRLSYLAPVRLYIFISFVTFFMIAVLPDGEDEAPKVKTSKYKPNVGYSYSAPYDYSGKSIMDSIKKLENDSIEVCREIKKIDELVAKGALQPSGADSIKRLLEIGRKQQVESKKNKNLFSFGYKSVKEMDSIRKIKPDEINNAEYWINKKSIELGGKYTDDELKTLFGEKVQQNIPKTLFIYMPLFALILWIFHNKKRWYYFDHGIFTLHYFSFLLLIQLILMLVSELLMLFDSTILNAIDTLINIAGYLWMFYYFFPAHHRFYGETRTLSFVKSMMIFFCNSILFVIVLTLLIIYTFANLH